MAEGVDVKQTGLPRFGQYQALGVDYSPSSSRAFARVQVPCHADGATLGRLSARYARLQALAPRSEGHSYSTVLAIIALDYAGCYGTDVTVHLRSVVFVAPPRQNACPNEGLFS